MTGSGRNFGSVCRFFTAARNLGRSRRPVDRGQPLDGAVQVAELVANDRDRERQPVLDEHLAVAVEHDAARGPQRNGAKVVVLGLVGVLVVLEDLNDPERDRQDREADGKEHAQADQPAFARRDVPRMLQTSTSLLLHYHCRRLRLDRRLASPAAARPSPPAAPRVDLKQHQRADRVDGRLGRQRQPRHRRPLLIDQRLQRRASPAGAAPRPRRPPAFGRRAWSAGTACRSRRRRTRRPSWSGRQDRRPGPTADPASSPPSVPATMPATGPHWSAANTTPTTHQVERPDAADRVAGQDDLQEDRRQDGQEHGRELHEPPPGVSGESGTTTSTRSMWEKSTAGRTITSRSPPAAAFDPLDGARPGSPAG